MCYGAIKNARIKEIVLGCMEPKHGFSNWIPLTDSISITKDVLGNQSAELMRTFFSQKRKQTVKTGLRIKFYAKGLSVGMIFIDVGYSVNKVNSYKPKNIFYTITNLYIRLITLKKTRYGVVFLIKCINNLFASDIVPKTTFGIYEATPFEFFCQRYSIHYQPIKLMLVIK